MKRDSEYYSLSVIYLYRIIVFSFQLILFPFFILIYFFIPKKKIKYLFGTKPILNNKYWVEALKNAGYKAETLMDSYYSINSKKDFDKYFDDYLPKYINNSIIRNFLIKSLVPFLVLLDVIKNAKILHCSYLGFAFSESPFWKIEALIYKIFKIKIIIISYGADSYMYSKIHDYSIRNGLLADYPNAVKWESNIQKKVNYWSNNADIILNAIHSDGLPRFDIPIHQLGVINVQKWRAKTDYSKANGKNFVVKILHTPNHRNFKGTEFILQAIENLKQKGYLIELIILEKTSNDQVKIIMQKVDIHCDQLIAVGYALSSIEAMASGLPVIANLEDQYYTNLYKRYCFLNECPIVSTSPENVEKNLEILISNPKLRKLIGQTSRKFVEKYHSYQTAQYLFKNIYQKLFIDPNYNIRYLFHPYFSNYNKKNYIHNPLLNKKLTDL